MLGVVGGLCIGLMCVTGALLAYERQVIQLVDGRARITPPSADAVRLPLDELLRSAGVPLDSVASLVIAADPAAPVQVRRSDRSVVQVDPYTAAVLAPSAPGKAQAVMSWLRGWHRWLGRQGELRAPARLVTGASNAAFVLLALTGAILWLPRRWTLHALWRAMRWRSGLCAAARDWNWHTTGGFWFGAPLLIIALTGVFISFSWPDRLLDRVAGSPAERQAAVASRPEREASGDAAAAPAAWPTDAPSRWMATAVQAVPAWTQLTLTLRPDGANTVHVVAAAGSSYRPDRRTTLVLDAASAAVRESRPYASLSLSRRLQGWVRFGHTGEAFGVAGQTVALLASVVGAVLVWTGLALSWRRLIRWRRRRAVQPISY